MLMTSKGGPLLRGYLLMNFKGEPPFGGCMLMNSRGGPTILRGDLPIGTISMDLAVHHNP